MWSGMRPHTHTHTCMFCLPRAFDIATLGKQEEEHCGSSRALNVLEGLIHLSQQTIMPLKTYKEIFLVFVEE